VFFEPLDLLAESMYNLANNFVFLSELKMNRKAILVIVAIFILGLGIGLAVGVIITNSKRKAAIADLQSKMKQSEAESQKIISSYESSVNRLNNELRQVKIELRQAKIGLQQANITLEKLKPSAVAQAPEPAVTAPAENEKTPAAPQDSSTLGNTRLYTVKEGDSPWKIAANQLGNGERYKEILKLNPDISPDGTNLTVGMKLKLPLH
jgi:hypothetical protein